MSDAKKIMFVMQRSPHGSIYPYEGLEFILISGAYEQDISLVFVGDGVYALKKDQDTSGIGIKGFVKTYRTLNDYDINKIYIDQKSMEERGLKLDDLVIAAEIKTSMEINQLMQEQHAIFPF